MNERDLILIEQYFRAELDEAGQLAFEKRVAEDEAFREEVHLHAQALEAVRLHGRAMLKQKLGARPMVKPARRMLFLWTGLAVVLLLGLIFIYGPLKNVKSPVNPVTIPPDSLQQAPSVPPDTSNRSAHPVQGKQSNPSQLFAQHFERFEDAQTRGATLRSGNAGVQADANTLLYYYQHRQYKEALSTFDQLPAALQTDDNILFFRANTLFAMKKPKEAAQLYDKIIERNDCDYLSEAYWFAALCALEDGNFPKTKKYLNAVKSGSNKTYQPKAAALLRELAQ